MKSRNLLNTQPTDSAATGTKGLLAVSAPKSGVAGDSVARRFELRYNASPRFARRRQERRQGQALLLAVLIMLLAALLSAVFLAVVSGNLNQSARIADKTRAIEASRTGIAFANAQLSGSSQGDLWRPIDVNPASIPVPANANYDFYYSQLDKVQGWASTLVPPTDTADPNYQRDLFRYRNDTYGKFPDPNQPSGDAPKFLVRVEELPTNPTAPDYDANHAGEIKITSIGLSDDDPNVFHRSIAYKMGRKKSPWASALRSVSNWDFGSKTPMVPAIQVKAPTVGGDASTYDAMTKQTTVTLDAPDVAAQLIGFGGKQQQTPFNIVINTPAGLRGAVVTDIGANALKLAGDLTPIPDKSRIEMAAAIGVGSGIDLLNTGTAAPFAQNFNQAKGILANGSTWLQGQIDVSNLNKFGTKIFTSGAIALDSANKNVLAPTTPALPSDPNPTYGIAGNGVLVSSNADNFPGTFTTNTDSDPNLNVTKLDLINDGWNKIGAKRLGLDYSNSRDVEPFKPAKIDSATNLARYRALTRNSNTDSNGDHLGVYIDNRDDVEKAYNMTTMRNEPMTQAQLVEMLMSPPVILPATAPADYARTGTAAAIGTVGSSLEQKHLRGWVGPDEFLARGALVEISPLPDLQGNTPSLRVTLDARGDSTTAAPNNDSGPVEAKAFRKTDGTLATGVYTKILPWPANGTLFAEGNLRIRGDVGDPTTNSQAPRSLTVVSLGNIYVEGSLSIDNTLNGANPASNRKKLMLMAKKNVIVNPTRAVLARTDVQTVATNTGVVTLNGTLGTPRPFTLDVANALLFNLGDYVDVTGPAISTPIRGLVTTQPTGNQLTITSTANGAIPVTIAATPTIVRSPLEKRDVGTGASDHAFFSLVDTENALNRRFLAPLIADSPNNQNKITFDHVGELKQDSSGATEGLVVKAEDFAPTVTRPTTFTATLTNKQPVDGSGDLDPIVRAVDPAKRFLRTTNNFPAGMQDRVFTQNTAKNLTAFAAEINAIQQDDGTPTPTTGYRYTAKPNPLSLGTLRSSALAGIGLRYAPGGYFDPMATSPAKNRPQDFSADSAVPGKFTIPLATSVEYDLDGASSLLNPTVNATFPDVRFIGFSPNQVSNDDSLTVDSSFYQSKANVFSSTIDPRVLALPTAAGFTLFPRSIVLKRTTALSAAATSDLLPDYQVRSLKVENINLTTIAMKAATKEMQVNAFVYAQEGSWIVIPGDYFRSNPQVRGERNGAGELIGSYIDYNSSKTADAPAVGQPTEYILDGAGNKVADLNRNGIADAGEKEAALRFVRYNTAPIKFYGAIVENQTAVVADVTVPGASIGDPPVIVQKGAVQDWMDKWATYADTGTAGGNVGAPNKFSFISYIYDPTLAQGSAETNQLRVPVTDDLLYEQ